jgi:tetratricopeptide (TPR) repeat protein
MIVKNEAANLARCLTSAAGAVDEIVVVDTGSTDDTIEIAETFAAKIYTQPWTGDFAAARNASLDRATGDYVLVLDADEELMPGAAPRLRAHLESGVDAFELITRNFAPANEVRAHHDRLAVRMFRNRPDLRYEGIIHESVRPALERAQASVVATGVVILHHGYASPMCQGDESRAERNLRLLESQLATHAQDAQLHFDLGVTHKAARHFELAQTHLEQAWRLGQHTLPAATKGELLTRLAQLALARHESARAITLATESLTFAADQPDAQQVLAVAHFELRDFTNAALALEALRASPLLNASHAKNVDAMLAFCREQLR